MANTYKPTSAVGEHHFGAEQFEADFTPAEERDWLDGKHIELVPRRYKVLSDNYTGGEQGELIEAALPVEIEAALISGGHLERARKAPKKEADNGEKDADGGDKDPDKKPAAKKPAARKKQE
jgi:hypothetical protein